MDHAKFDCRRLLAAVCLLGLLIGCSHDDKTYGKVSGRITANSKAVVAAMVLFQDPAQHIFIQATTDSDGHYDFDKLPGKGLPVGNYQVAVQPPIQEIRTGEPLPPPKPFPKIDEKFCDPERSGLKLEVKAGDNPFDIDLSGYLQSNHAVHVERTNDLSRNFHRLRRACLGGAMTGS